MSDKRREGKQSKDQYISWRREGRIIKTVLFDLLGVRHSFLIDCQKVTESRIMETCRDRRNKRAALGLHAEEPNQNGTQNRSRGEQRDDTNSTIEYLHVPDRIESGDLVNVFARFSESDSSAKPRRVMTRRAGMDLNRAFHGKCGELRKLTANPHASQHIQRF